MANFVPQSASGTFPGCALSCAVLLQGQNVCHPPSVAQSNQMAYNQCFCTTPSLNAFYSTPDGICTAECTIESDRQLLQAWYKNFCVLVSQGQDPTAQNQNGGAATTVTSTSTASLATNTAGATYTGASTSEGSTSGGGHQDWIHTHWKWILMIVILAIGFAILAGVLVWFKRRHRRKLDAKRKAASGFTSDTEKRPDGPKRVATPDLWGPHQMMQATQGYQYTTDGIPAESSKRPALRKGESSTSRGADSDRIEVAEVSSPTFNPIRINKRTRPSELENNARLIGAADRLSKGKRERAKQPQMTDKDVEASLQGKAKSKPHKDEDSEKT